MAERAVLTADIWLERSGQYFRPFHHTWFVNRRHGRRWRACLVEDIAFGTKESMLLNGAEAPHPTFGKKTNTAPFMSDTIKICRHPVSISWFAGAQKRKVSITVRAGELHMSTVRTTRSLAGHLYVRCGNNRARQFCQQVCVIKVLV